MFVQVQVEFRKAPAQPRHNILKYVAVAAVSLITQMEQGNLVFMRHHQCQPHLPEVVPFLFVFPALGNGATVIVRGDKGKEIGGVVEKGIRINAVARAHLLEQLCFNGFYRLDGDGVHHVPEMLAVHLAQRRAQHILAGGGFRPGPPAAFACGRADPSHGAQQQCCPYGQVVAQRLGRKVFAFGMDVLIDGLHEVQFAGDAQQRGNGAVGV